MLAETLEVGRPVLPVVWLLLKSERSAVVEVSGKFTGGPFAKDVDRSGHFLLRDSLILLLFGGRSQTLPGQSSLREKKVMIWRVGWWCWWGYLYKVHEDVPETLHVVSPALLYPEVGVDAGVSGRPCQVLVFPVGNVLVSPSVSVLLS